VNTTVAGDNDDNDDAENSMTACSNTPCDNCDEVQDAEWFCQICNMHYCDECFTIVHKPRAMAKHEKVAIQSQQATVNSTAAKKHYCGKHPDKIIEINCKECDDMCALRIGR